MTKRRHALECWVHAILVAFVYSSLAAAAQTSDPEHNLRGHR